MTSLLWLPSRQKYCLKNSNLGVPTLESDLRIITIALEWWRFHRPETFSMQRKMNLASAGRLGKSCMQIRQSWCSAALYEQRVCLYEQSILSFAYVCSYSTDIVYTCIIGWSENGLFSTFFF